MCHKLLSNSKSRCTRGTWSFMDAFLVCELVHLGMFVQLQCIFVELWVLDSWCCKKSWFGKVEDRSVYYGYISSSKMALSLFEVHWQFQFGQSLGFYHKPNFCCFGKMTLKWIGEKACSISMYATNTSNIYCMDFIEIAWLNLHTIHECTQITTFYSIKSPGPVAL